MTNAFFPCKDHHFCKPCCFNKNYFHEFNCNMAIDGHPVLVDDFTSLLYDINFRADFLDKCRFHWDYDNNLVYWMKYDIPLCDTAGFFSYSYYSSLFTPIDIALEDNCLGNACINFLQHASLMLNMNRPTSMMLPLTNTISCWISSKIYSIYYPNTKYIWLPWSLSTQKRSYWSQTWSYARASLCLSCSLHPPRNVQRRTWLHGWTWYP